ncbi:MAG: DnaJ C-terminal domain-containing protein [Adlercreutzia equolifaciens]
MPDRQRVSVEIPKGIRDGQQLRIHGFGEAGMQGAPAGDLIVTGAHRPRRVLRARRRQPALQARGSHVCRRRSAPISKSTASTRTRRSRLPSPRAVRTTRSCA